MNLLNRFKGFSVALICFVSVSALGHAADRFAIAVGSQDKLIVFGPKGDRAAEVAVPTIAQNATAGDVSFQLSYGRDSGGQLTAILTPSATSPAALHFNVLGKAVDAEGAVVTLTFAKNLQSVTIDPGYVGSVEVNSHRLRRHNLAEELAPQPTITPKQVVAPVQVAVSQPSENVAPVATAAPAETPTPASTPKPLLAPATLASQMSPLLAKPTTSDRKQVASSEFKPAAGTEVASSQPTEMTTETVRLYWAEPVTAPDGSAPACKVDEIKLVELHGSVSITLPDGKVQTGAEGMTIPSGTVVATDENSSVALFLGGVNSARLMPKCDLTITQSMEGSTRHNLVELRHGAVFSRIGSRDGELQDYEVRTPEGSTKADTANMLAFRGTEADLPGVRSARNLLNLDRHTLLAWNPVSLGRNLASDVIRPLFGAIIPPPTSVFYYASGTTLNPSQIGRLAIASTVTNGQNSPNSPNDPNTILQGVLTQVLPFNTKLNALLTIVNSGNATRSQLGFYHNLISVFFTKQIPGIAKKSGASSTAGIQATALALLRDLRPFQVPRVTPF